MSVGAVVGVECIEQGTQHAALWGASAEAEGRGCMGAHSYPLRAVCQKVLNPEAGGVSYSSVLQFGHQSVGEDGVKSRAKIYEQQLSIAPLLLQVGHGGLWPRHPQSIY